MKILLLLPSKIKQIFFRKFFNNKKIIISKIIILNKKKIQNINNYILN